jgi:hypothetical protein
MGLVGRLPDWEGWPLYLAQSNFVTVLSHGIKTVRCVFSTNADYCGLPRPPNLVFYSATSFLVPFAL